MADEWDQFQDDWDAFADAPQGGAPARPKRASQGLGFYKGVMKPLDNAAIALESGAEAVGVPVDQINNLFRMPSSRDARDQREVAIAANSRRPGMVGEIAGNVVGTIPAMAATRNPWIGGGASGGLLSNAETPQGFAFDVGMGAGLNYFGGKAVDAVADFVKPTIDGAVRRLSDAGVQLTPGMIKGGRAMVREDKAMSRPGVGAAIASGRERTMQTFNSAAVDEVLKPLGIRVPAPIKPGVDRIAFAKDAISRAYDQVIPNLTLQLDPAQFAQRVAPKIATLEPAQLAQFQKVVSATLANTRAVGAKGPGQAIKDAQGEIRRLASGYSRGQSQAERDLGRALWAADEELTAALIAQNPKWAPQLQKVNEAYRGYRTVADAASRADDGLFNTGQLRQSVRRGDRSKNKDATARGDAFMWEFSNDARNVIPSRTPNSGTADRLNAGNLFANIRGQAEAFGYAADEAVQRARLAPRPAMADPAARTIRRLKAPVAGASVAGGQRLRD